MNIPFLDLKAQYKTIKAEVEPAIASVINDCSFILGPAVEAFEQNFAAFCNAKHCIGLNSGTSALELIFRSLKPDGYCEAIAPANTFFATVEAMVNAGITPVLVDCNKEDALINTNKIEAAITEHTAFIVPVHLYGQMTDMDPIISIAAKHKLYVVEDSAQAHGATYQGKPAGSFGIAAGFSFYPGKNLGAFGDAGGVVTSNDALAEQLRMHRDHGMREKYNHQIIGDNDRMDGIQGAVLNVKLPHLAAWNEARRERAQRYQKNLAGHAGVTLFAEHADRNSVYHLLVVQVQNREAVQQALQAKGIATGMHYPIAIHKQRAFADTPLAQQSFPVAEELSSTILSLPMYAELPLESVDYVCEALIEATT